MTVTCCKQCSTSGHTALGRALPVGCPLAWSSIPGHTRQITPKWQSRARKFSAFLVLSPFRRATATWPSIMRALRVGNLASREDPHPAVGDSVASQDSGFEASDASRFRSAGGCRSRSQRGSCPAVLLAGVAPSSLLSSFSARKENKTGGTP